jgi:hypothetical protein
MSSIHTTKNGRELWNLCLELSRKHGMIMDVTRFLNELQLRFYRKDTSALFELGLRNKLYYTAKGNLFFLLKGCKTMIEDIDLRKFCRWCRYRGKMSEEVLVTCMCGHFHSYPKAMRKELKRMQSLGLIIVNTDKTISIV